MRCSQLAGINVVQSTLREMNFGTADQAACAYSLVHWNHYSEVVARNDRTLWLDLSQHIRDAIHRIESQTQIQTLRWDANLEAYEDRNGVMRSEAASRAFTLLRVAAAHLQHLQPPERERLRVEFVSDVPWAEPYLRWAARMEGPR